MIPLICGCIALIALVAACVSIGRIKLENTLIFNKREIINIDIDLGHDVSSSYSSLAREENARRIEICKLISEILVVIAAAITLFYMLRNQIVVTSKRVYGTASFGKRVDIPIDSVSSIGTGFLKSVVVASSSGRIVFAGLDNYKEIHKAVGDLLLDRQETRTHTEQDSPVLDDAEQIKKFKMLLDEGAISQEEYELKKRQILGY